MGQVHAKYKNRKYIIIRFKKSLNSGLFSSLK
jgi:hypothetical protein